MIIVDKALDNREKQGNLIRVGLVGAGFMGRGIARQIVKCTRGMRLVAIANRSPDKATLCYKRAGVDRVYTVESIEQLEESIRLDRYCISNDPLLLCESESIDAVIEATGDVEAGAKVALEAIKNKKHTILANAELDATLGPILKIHGDRAGVVVTNVDGDQPGVLMNLLRFVRSIGCNPVLAGNIKGFLDPYRTPDTQKKFASLYSISPEKATLFADGTKLSLENAIVANATGFKVGKRGMYGPRCAHVSEVVSLFGADELLSGGLVDYILGAEPQPGVFVLGYNEEPIDQQYLKYFKMGDGPFYLFYTAYHLPIFEAPFTVARAVLFNDAAIAPLAGPVCDVVTVAKRDLKAGERLDGMGGFTCYGMIENFEVSQTEDLIPIGLSNGCLLTSDIQQDRAITYADVKLPKGRSCDVLREEQNVYWSGRQARDS